MLTRDQKYAATIFAQLEPYQPTEGETEERITFRKKYGSMAHKMPVLIRTAGLPQALAFVDAKAAKEPAWRQLLDDLSQAVGYPDLHALLKESREPSSLSAYMHVTIKTLDALLWYKRFAQSVLDVEAGQDGGDAT